MRQGPGVRRREGRPLFVMGTARSGSTLLAKLLDAHPLINLASDPFLPLFRCLRDALLQDSPGFIPGEPLQDFYYLPQRLAQLETLLSADLSVPFPSQRWSEQADSACARLGMENPELVGDLDHLGGRDFHEVFAAALELVARRKPGGQAWVGCKEVWVIDFLPALARAFTQARFVVINRDPRGVLASLLQLSQRDPTQMAHLVSYLRHWRKQVACLRIYRTWPWLDGRILVLRYEDLVADPAGHAQALCSFLELEAHPNMLEPMSYRGRSARETWLGNAASGRPLSRIEAAQATWWRRSLAPDVGRLAELVCWPDAELCWYAPFYGDPRRLTSDASLWQTFLQQDQGNFSWRSDLGLPLLDYGAELARRPMLEPGAAPAPERSARCAFLFSAVYDSLRDIALRNSDRRPTEQADAAYGG